MRTLGFANTISILVFWLRLRNLRCCSGGPWAHLQRLPQNKSAVEPMIEPVRCRFCGMLNCKKNETLNKQDGTDISDIITYHNIDQ